MKSPVVCPSCQRIVVIKAGQESCHHCEHKLEHNPKGISVSQAPQNESISPSTGVWKVPDEWQWCLILIVIGIGFLIWGAISPEATIKRRSWSSGAAMPVGWVGGLFLGIGILAATVMGCFGQKKQDYVEN